MALPEQDTTRNITEKGAMPVFTVGLTGGIGSGKTTAAQRFEQHGVILIDTDHIARKLTAPGGKAIAQIQEEFGHAFILPDGALDRNRMRACIFNDDTAKARLESILHPLILSDCDEAARLAQGIYILFAVPLLVESSHWIQRVQRILLIDCDEETQIRRAMQRSNLSREQVLAIMARQASRQTRQCYADEVIVNSADTSLEQLYEQVDKVHAYYLTLANR